MPSHLSTAGRLLVAIAREGAFNLDDIARHARIARRQLEECRDGVCPLEPEAQMRLAAAVLVIAPEHERKAYALYGQAQAALRMREDPGRSHQFYPRDRFP
jgi:hypothetical protein